MFQSTRPARGATACSASMNASGLFQSTRPARGATSAQARPPRTRGFQSTRPARGATRLMAAKKLGMAVSIHAPRAGRDPLPRLTR